MSQPDRPSRPRPVPVPARVAAAVIAIGLLLDLAEHTIGAGPGGLTGSVSPGQHAAHLVVLTGMVLALTAIVRDGYRMPRRTRRREGSASHAVR